jgi:4,5-DOPA dioxygenase extradiol
MLYDYYGFPDEAYQLKYPAPGSPELASHVVSLLRKAGFKTAEDRDRGFDHGVFVPLMLLYPEADIPVVCLSLLSSLYVACRPLHSPILHLGADVPTHSRSG